MHVIVTGASGFLGRNFLLRTPRDWRVTALYHRTRDLPEFVERHQLTHVRAQACNLLDAEDVGRLAAAGSVDAVMYFAANGDPAISSEQPRRDLEANAVAVVTFLEHVRAEHIVYVSSGAVYDGLTGIVTPGVCVSPRLPYAISKLASEQYVRFFVERRATAGSYVNVRFFGAYGPYEAERKITTRWLRAMAAGQREFVVRGDGRNLIDFMYVDDAIDGFLSLVQARDVRLTVDFASGAPVSIDDLVYAMARAVGAEITVRHEGVVPEYIEFRSGDATMAERFGWGPRVSFEDGFTRLQRFFAGAAPAPQHGDGRR